MARATRRGNRRCVRGLVRFILLSSSLLCFSAALRWSSARFAATPPRRHASPPPGAAMVTSGAPRWVSRERCVPSGVALVVSGAALVTSGAACHGSCGPWSARIVSSVVAINRSSVSPKRPIISLKRDARTPPARFHFLLAARFWILASSSLPCFVSAAQQARDPHAAQRSRSTQRAPREQRAEAIHSLF
jgi:hypothetical protein